MPADPFEAELLMMAEAVAVAEKGSDDSSDESDTETSKYLFFLKHRLSWFLNVSVNSVSLKRTPVVFIM